VYTGLNFGMTKVMDPILNQEMVPPTKKNFSNDGTLDRVLTATKTSAGDTVGRHAQALRVETDETLLKIRLQKEL